MFSAINNIVWNWVVSNSNHGRTDKEKGVVKTSVWSNGGSEKQHSNYSSALEMSFKKKNLLDCHLKFHSTCFDVITLEYVFCWRSWVVPPWHWMIKAEDFRRLEIQCTKRGLKNKAPLRHVSHQWTLLCATESGVWVWLPIAQLVEACTLLSLEDIAIMITKFKLFRMHVRWCYHQTMFTGE